MATLRMAAVAAPFGRDLEEDFARISTLVADARASGVRLLALPEACLGGYLTSLDGPEDLPPALRSDGLEIRRLAALAREMVVVAGYCEQDDDGRPLQQRGLRHGRRRARELPQGAPAAPRGRELRAGDRFAAFDSPVGRLGLQICYDKAFPEAARALALDGAEIVVSVSAWPLSATNPHPDPAQDRWTRRFDLFDRARALENQIVWLAANQSGTFGSLRFAASAKIVDPGGEVARDDGLRPQARRSRSSTLRRWWSRPVVPWDT